VRLVPDAPFPSLATAVGRAPNCRSALAEPLGIGQSVAMATGIASYPWSLTQLAELLD
jgi:hypothetical protein